MQQLMAHADRPADKAVSQGAGWSLESREYYMHLHVWGKHNNIMRGYVYIVRKEANVLGTSVCVLLAV